MISSDASRVQGWNFCVKITLSSRADMAHFETNCAAHKDLKINRSRTMTDVVALWFETATGETEVPKAADSVE